MIVGTAHTSSVWNEPSHDQAAHDLANGQVGQRRLAARVGNDSDSSDEGDDKRDGADPVDDDTPGAQSPSCMAVSV